MNMKVAEEAPVEKVIEKAYFHIENGGMTLSIVAKQRDDGHHEYRFRHEMASHGASVEGAFPLGSSEIVSWMNMALQRVSLRVSAESSRGYQMFDPPSVQIQNGVEIEKTASLLRIVARFEREAKEFPSPEALREYLKEHPGADRANHSVKKPEKGNGKENGKSKETLKEMAEEHGESVKEEEKEEHEYIGWGALIKENFHEKVTDRLKALWKSKPIVKKFVQAAPEAIKKFVMDGGTRRKVLMAAHDAFVKLPETTYKAVKDSFKRESHEFKEAATGVRDLFKGKPMNRAQKNAVMACAWDATRMLIGTVLTGGLIHSMGAKAIASEAAKGFVSDFAKKVATNALVDELDDINIPGDIQEVVEGLHHLVEFGLDRAAAKNKKSKADDLDYVMAFSMWLTKRAMSKFTPDDFADVVEHTAEGKSYEQPKPKKDKKTAAYVITPAGIVPAV
jgi:hypothetical protein